MASSQDGERRDPDRDADAERGRRRSERERRRRSNDQGALGDRVERLSGVPGGGPGGGAPDLSRAVILRRRLLAGAGVIAAVVVVVLVASGGGEGDREQEPAAAEPAPKVSTVTIPEGLTRTQIAALAKQAKLKGSYERATKRAPRGFDPAEYGARGAPSLEGFLFPATYELNRRAPAGELVRKQLAAFEDNLAEVDQRAARRKNLTTYDLLKIASMIEREVSIPRERRLVAAVIYNRLADGEPLGIDATLRYELDNFDQPLKESELAAPTPYNTRLNAGLPPTPIGNPGRAAIEAAANPADKDYRFYVIKPGTCNEHFFTADQAEFDRAAAEYQAALEAEGGSPTECPE